jgi:hypothetical protein
LPLLLTNTLTLSEEGIPNILPWKLLAELKWNCTALLQFRCPNTNINFCPRIFNCPSWEAVQEITRSLWNPKIHYRVHKSPPLEAITNQMNPVHILTHHFS